MECDWADSAQVVIATVSCASFFVVAASTYYTTKALRSQGRVNDKTLEALEIAIRLDKIREKSLRSQRIIDKLNYLGPSPSNIGKECIDLFKEGFSQEEILDAIPIMVDRWNRSGQGCGKDLFDKIVLEIQKARFLADGKKT